MKTQVERTYSLDIKGLVLHEDGDVAGSLMESGADRLSTSRNATQHLKGHCIRQGLSY